MEFELDLETESVAEAQPRRPLCVDRAATVRQTMRRMQAENTSSAMICDGDKLVGVWTEKDAVKIMSEGGNLDAPIETVMVRDPIQLTPDDSVGKAIELMAVGRFRRLPIVDGAGAVQGVLKVSGILHYLVEHFPQIVYTLPPSPHYKPADREGA